MIRPLPRQRLRSLSRNTATPDFINRRRCFRAGGRADEAMTVLKRALELGDSGLTYAYIDPTLDALRRREDFRLLLKSLGFI